MVLAAIQQPMVWLLSTCYGLVGGYAASIVFFTLLTKIILIPIFLWTQRNGIKMVELTPKLNALKIKYYGDKDAIAEETQTLYKQVGYHPLASTIPMFIQLALLIGVIGAVRELLVDTESMLSVRPAQIGGTTLLLPLVAGFSALALGLAQNRLNPLQREQSPSSQWATNGFSIAISLSLGAFVPMGVGIYWIASNLLTILQQMLLNAIMPPIKYVDYDALAKSKAELAEIEELSTGVSKEDKQREKADYKRFFSVANKHLVFYSERSGFYKYFQDVIEYLLSHSNIIIHYITSDPKDQIFALAEAQPRIRPYYIGEKRLITLMMKMDADMVVMTMPDLDNFHIKRSYVRKDVEYVYMFHAPLSFIMTIRENALDHYDTIFCTGPHQVKEIRECERVYQLKTKNIVECGYGVIENMRRHYEENKQFYTARAVKEVLIAPSWQEDNILDSCLDEILEHVLGNGWKIIVRPHPEYVKRYPDRMKRILEKHGDKLGEMCVIETDFSSNETVYRADILITDWSWIAYEYSLATKKPSLFINTKMKIANPNWNKIPLHPLNLALRSEIGQQLEKHQIGQIADVIEELFIRYADYENAIGAIAEKYLFHFGESGKYGGKYILKSLSKKGQ